MSNKFKYGDIVVTNHNFFKKFDGRIQELIKLYYGVELKILGIHGTHCYWVKPTENKDVPQLMIEENDISLIELDEKPSDFKATRVPHRPNNLINDPPINPH